MFIPGLGTGGETRAHLVGCRKGLDGRLTKVGYLWRRTWDIWVLNRVVGGLQKWPVGCSR